MRLICIKAFLPVFACLLWVGSVFAEAEKAVIEIEVSGVNETIQKSIIDGLTIQRQRNSERLSVRLVDRLHQSAQAEIRQTLSVYGYYNPVINADLQQTGERQWQASYQIETGEPVRITANSVPVQTTHGIARSASFVLSRASSIRRFPC